MNCLETEKLIGYAYRLLEGAAASEVRAHLPECPRCRQIVEQYGRLDALLDGWEGMGPTPGFDARVRQSVEAQGPRRGPWAWWGWGRGLALASLAGLIVAAGMVWFTRSHATISHLSPLAVQQPRPESGTPGPARMAKAHSSAVVAKGNLKPAHAASQLKLANGVGLDDKDAQALEDYDLAANFDLLSELPKEEPRVAN